GLVSGYNPISDNASNKDELHATFKGILGWPTQRSATEGQYFVSSQIPTEQNRWTGANFGAYTDSTLDDLYTRYVLALNGDARLSLFADMMKRLTDEAVSISLYYDYSTYIAAYRKGVSGPVAMGATQPATSWNAAT